MNVFYLIGINQAISQQTRVPSDSTQTVVIVATCILIAIIGGRIIRGKMARNSRKLEAKINSPIIEGRIVAIKPQTGFDRERSRVDIRVKLEYVDPDLGAERTVLYILDRNTENLPPQISSIGAGITDTGALIGRFREMEEKRKKLEALGYTKEQIKIALMENALEHASHAPTESDTDGYLVLDEPVEVDVYLNNVRDNPENGVHVVFREKSQS